MLEAELRRVHVVDFLRLAHQHDSPTGEAIRQLWEHADLSVLLKEHRNTDPPGVPPAPAAGERTGRRQHGRSIVLASLEASGGSMWRTGALPAGVAGAALSIALTLLVASVPQTSTTTFTTGARAAPVRNGAIITGSWLLSARTKQPVAPPWTFTGAVEFSPDGSQVAWADSERTDATPPGTYLARLWVQDLRPGGQVREVAAVPDLAKGFDWSPDGAKLVLLAGRDDHARLHLVDADGSGAPQTLLDDPVGVIGDPRWSPTGRYLTFLRNWAFAADQFLLELDTGRLIPVTHRCTWPRRLDRPGGDDCSNDATGEWTWAPDGRALYGTRTHHRGGHDLLRYSLRTGRTRVLLRDDEHRFTSLVASPDGRRLAFTQQLSTRQFGDRTLLATIPVDGGRVRVLHRRWPATLTSWQACPDQACVPVGTPRTEATVQTQTRLRPRRIRVDGLVTPAAEAGPAQVTSFLQIRHNDRWRTHDTYRGGVGAGRFNALLARPEHPHRCRLVTEYAGSPWLNPTRHRSQVDC